MLSAAILLGIMIIGGFGSVILFLEACVGKAGGPACLTGVGLEYPLWMLIIAGIAITVTWIMNFGLLHITEKDGGFIFLNTKVAAYSFTIVVGATLLIGIVTSRPIIIAIAALTLIVETSINMSDYCAIDHEW